MPINWTRRCGEGRRRRKARERWVSHDKQWGTRTMPINWTRRCGEGRRRRKARERWVTHDKQWGTRTMPINWTRRCGEGRRRRKARERWVTHDKQWGTRTMPINWMRRCGEGKRRTKARERWVALSCLSDWTICGFDSDRKSCLYPITWLVFPNGTKVILRYIPFIPLPAIYVNSISRIKLNSLLTSQW